MCVLADVGAALDVRGEACILPARRVGLDAGGVDAMCESTVFLKDGSREKVLMKDVATVRPRDGKLLLVSVLGEQLEVEAVVAELDLMGHRIVVESPPAGGGRR